MSGPQRTLDSLFGALQQDRADIDRAIRRMREANRRLTGSTGEAPTPLNQVAVKTTLPPQDEPLLMRLTIEQALMSEVILFEGIAGTVEEAGTAMVSGAVGRTYDKF